MVDEERTCNGGGGAPGPQAPGAPASGPQNEGCACCAPRPAQEVAGERIRLTQLSSKAG